MGMMQLLLLSLGLALVWGLHAHHTCSKEHQPDVSKKWWMQLSGTWYTVALASNVTAKIEEGGPLRIFVQKLIIENGNLRAVFFKRENGKCIQFSVSANPPEKDSPMKVKYSGINDLYIKSFKEDEYVIFILYNHNNKEVTLWGHLFGRTPHLSDNIKKKFEEICINAGLKKEHILDVSEAGILRKPHLCLMGILPSSSKE
ncbi:trichosurin-like isoform X1 [Sminthopsis crassicaudata]|uniref:trichosurin-like isoform X1 n=1 Tax=Sminthopsis crassicaudata TaxID=9301 RepID=UPI003D68168E